MYPNQYDIYETFQILNDLFSIGFRDAIEKRNNFQPWYSNNRDSLSNLEIWTGSTKVVIIPEDCLCNWVIKLDFKDANWRSEHLNKSPIYCTLEAENYRKACDNHLEEYFAATYNIGEYEGFVIILQERVNAQMGHTIASEAFFQSAEDTYIPWADDETSSDKRYNISDEIDNMCDDERLFAIFGSTDLIDDLIEFCSENCINDIHENNYGTRLNGDIVIIDFSGY